MRDRNNNPVLPPQVLKLSHAGVSLAEVLVCVLIFGMAALGLFRLFLYCSQQADLARNMTLAMTEAQDKLEEIRNHPFNQIPADYGTGSAGEEFDLSLVTGKGVVSINTNNPKLLKVRVVVCWQNQNGRVIGEDKNLDGELDSTEDAAGNNDGVIDSSAVIESYIAEL